MYGNPCLGGSISRLPASSWVSLPPMAACAVPGGFFRGEKWG